MDQKTTKEQHSKTVTQRGRQMGRTEQMRREAGCHHCSGPAIDEVSSAMRAGGTGRRFRGRIEG
jgi:hypothetical protein